MKYTGLMGTDVRLGEASGDTYSVRVFLRMLFLMPARIMSCLSALPCAEEEAKEDE